MVDLHRARRAIESLRTGVPPKGRVRSFTVGRAEEIARLDHLLHDDGPGALLLLANYGAGKSHLLRYIEELALDLRYAVSWVTVDAGSGVRFNRMDQLVGAVWRGLRVPGGETGPIGLLDLAVRAAEDAKAHPGGSLWSRLTDDWHWGYSEELRSPALFAVLRAWAANRQAVRDVAIDFLCQPWNYRSQRKRLYLELVERHRRFFRDPRQEWQFYSNGVFLLHPAEYGQAWGMLDDIHVLAEGAGLRGLVLLFDEFEDVITNMRNIAHQEAAFWNLFRFFGGKRFTGRSFFAVTPLFAQRCKQLLLAKGRVDFDHAQFDRLPTFRMQPLELADLLAFASKVVEEHSRAYGWRVPQHVVEQVIGPYLKRQALTSVGDRTREAIIGMVKLLDANMHSA